jgi:uncharacterized protein with HEPN domain
MLSDSDRSTLGHIQHNIALARYFTQGIDLATFLLDVKTFYAVTRCLEIISEASRRLSPEFKENFASLPWRDIATAGNYYRHDYEDVLERRVWETVHEALPDLSAVVDAALNAAK